MIEDFNNWNKVSEDKHKFNEFWEELTDNDDVWEVNNRLAWQIMQMQSVISNMATRIDELNIKMYKPNEKHPFERVD